MNVLMFTNTFTPHVGGVARSVKVLSEQLRARGHDVLVVAPTFDGHLSDSEGVLRVPSLKHIGGSAFSLPVPFSRSISKEIDEFAPDIVHSHHPFFLGAKALRIAARHAVPIIYTYHTRYDFYGHYVTISDNTFKDMMRSLSSGYCELVDVVIAPSESIQAMLVDEGVSTRIEVVPTGIRMGQFSNGNSAVGRSQLGVSPEAFVVGHVGRLEEEKNLEFLARSLIHFLQAHEAAHVIIAGQGSAEGVIEKLFAAAGFRERVHFAGVLGADDLADFYAAMDVFAFSSLSETQGLVLIEAMAAAKPVVAIDAEGVREVVSDGRNGRLLPRDTTSGEFAGALRDIAGLGEPERGEMEREAVRTAEKFTVEKMGERVERLYSEVCTSKAGLVNGDDSKWQQLWREFQGEEQILENLFHAIEAAIMPQGMAEPK